MREISQVFGDVAIEIIRQKKLKAQGKFKYVCSDPQLLNEQRFTILTEEIGEVARALNDYKTALDKCCNGWPMKTELNALELQLKSELTQSAAVICSWLCGIE